MAEMTELSGDEPLRPRGPRGVTALTAAALGFLLACPVVYVPSEEFIAIPSGFSVDILPVDVLAELGLYAVAGILLLVGALVTLFRGVAGAVLLLIGSTAAVVAVAAEPALGYQGGYRAYIDYLTAFRDLQATARVVDLGGALLVFGLAALPVTFRYLRHRAPAAETYGRPRAYPPERW
jgi:hypothetical protein